MQWPQGATKSPGPNEFGLNPLRRQEIIKIIDEPDAFPEDRIGTIDAVFVLQAINAEFMEAWADHAAVYGAGTTAEDAGLKYDDRCPPSRQGKCRAEPGKSGSDNRNIDRSWKRNRLGLGSWGLFPPIRCCLEDHLSTYLRRLDTGTRGHVDDRRRIDTVMRVQIRYVAGLTEIVDT